MNAHTPIDTAGREAWEDVDTRLERILGLANVMAHWAETVEHRGARAGLHALIQAIEEAGESARVQHGVIWQALRGVESARVAQN